MLIEKPGIYKNVTIEDYHRSMGISASGINKILISPKTYWYEYLSGEVKEEKESFIFGNALHTLVLEPETFNDRFHVYQGMDRRTKAGKEAWELLATISKDKDLMSEDDFKEVSLMAQNIRDHAFFKKVIQSDGACIEDSLLFLDDEIGANLRSRPDYYNTNSRVIVDFKTTKSASPFSFARSIIDYGYHRQGAIALDGLTKLTGDEYTSVILFAVEKEPPYLVACYLLPDEAITLGRKQYKRGARTYKACLDNDFWPGYEEIIMPIELPRWAFNEEEGNE